MRLTTLFAALLALLIAAQPAAARITTAQAIAGDPAPDAKFPARLEMIHVPKVVHVAADHSGSDHRIALETLVIDGLQGLLAKG
ncbi:MAG: hypothetical protein JWP35_446 [Caulobacter sp.]|nr:hypothetical protein [Caulobacter sp.]